ncbi:MAG: acylneuraminate cytidylyltransferase family protein [Lachnospiraceae bacterium]|nr:acylneuraminate cytidylyltransferase family protein [Lachnospiraceae bacterium]
MKQAIMNILFTVCGRAGSKGIKNKNVRNFIDKPLVYYTLSVIDMYIKKHPENTCDIALNTDSDLLKNMVLDYRRLTITWIERKKELAGDKVAKRDVLVDTLKSMKILKSRKYDIVVDLDITSPLRTINNVEQAIDKQRDTDSDVVFSVTQARRNPYFNMVKEGDRGYERALSSPYNTRQEAPDLYDMNASIYVYKERHLLDGKGVLEGYNEVVFMKDTGILDLDKEDDMELMQVIAEFLIHTDREYKEIYENIYDVNAENKK